MGLGTGRRGKWKRCGTDAKQLNVTIPNRQCNNLVGVIMDKKASMKRVAEQAVKGHEKRMHGAKKMAKGGVTTDQRMALGRGLAKVANQKTG